MGLDMFLYEKDKNKEVEKMKSEPTEFGYWRKHHDLHDHIGDLWRKKTGSTREFNCIRFKLSPEMMKDILALAVSGVLASETNLRNYDDDYTVRIFKEALKLSDEGQTIVYDSWW